MNKRTSICVIICFIAVCFISGTALAQKVVVISGVAEKDGPAAGYDMVHKGIEEGLSPSGVEIVYQWKDLDREKDPAKKDAMGADAIATAKAANPDLIIVLGDNCLRHVGVKIDDTPVVFSYVFADTRAFKELPKPNITGVTRASYAVDIWAMANKLLGAKTVALISKTSPSMEGVKKYLAALADKIEAGSGVRYKDMFLVSTFDEWKNVVNGFSEDFIYLADTSRITDGDRTLSREEVTGWTVENAKKPVIAAAERDVAAGALYSIVTSEKAMGNLAAELADKVLKGAKPGDLPFAKSKKGKLLVNMKTAEKYQVEIPYEILSTAEKVFE